MNLGRTIITTISLFTIAIALLFSSFSIYLAKAEFKNQAQVYNFYNYPTNILEQSNINTLEPSNIILEPTGQETVNQNVSTETVNIQNSIDNSTLIQNQTTVQNQNTINSTVTPVGGVFIYPSQNEEIKGIFQIKFQIENTDVVEIYLRRLESSSEVYLGRAMKEGTNIWNYTWQSSSTPNGSYYIISKVMNGYGTYSSGTVFITVNNASTVSQETVRSANNETIQTDKQIQTEESRIESQEQELLRSITEQVQRLSQEAQGLVPSGENSTELNQEFQNLSREILETNNIKEGEGLNQKRQELDDSIDRISQLITNSSGKESEISDLEKKIVNQVNESIGEIKSIIDEKQIIEEQKKEFLAKDSDMDGATDQEEARLGTNPFNSDSDSDGFLDGSEISLGFDPLTPSPADKIQYQDPVEIELLISSLFIVKNVELTVKEETQEKALKIQGKAPPFSFVTIYIYSLPIVVVAKADADGNWEYILDKSLSDGKHTVYATVTNNKGEIEKGSQPFDFEKTENNIIKLLKSDENTIESPADYMHKRFVILILAVMLIAVIFVLVAIGVYFKQETKSNG